MSRLRVWGVGGQFPFLHRLKHFETRPSSKDDVRWVVFRNGTLGVVDHYKTDGTVAVRPVDPETGEYFPNVAAHWTLEQRMAIPQEVVVTPGEIRQAMRNELPRTATCR